MPTDPFPVPVVELRSPSSGVSETVARRRAGRVVAILMQGLLLLASGCSLFEHPVERVAPSPLGWLTSWNNQPLANTKPFDLETIRPSIRPAQLGPDTLLEMTVWDLYEPGRPHTFPVRVSAKQTVEVPLLGEQVVTGRSLSELELTLAEEFRRRDLLKTPRILVRNLESSHVRVQVTGAVARPGFVELARDQASVYDALVAAGGLKNLAGNQIAVSHRAVLGTTTAQTDKRGALVRAQSPDHNEPAEEVSRGPKIRSARHADMAPPVRQPEPEPVAEVVEEEPAAEAVEEEPSETEPAAPVEQPEAKVSEPSRANRIEEISVPLPPQQSQAKPVKSASIPSPMKATPAPQSLESRIPSVEKKSPASIRPASNSSDDRTIWYDISREADRAALQGLVLTEGDNVQVKAAAPPIRIAGSVVRPGDYALPAGRVLDLWQALELAGGVKSSGSPLVVTLLRPPGDGRGPQRWQRQFESLDKRPTDAPKIQPGDVIDLSPPTGTRLRKAVGGLWNR